MFRCSRPWVGLASLTFACALEDPTYDQFEDSFADDIGFRVGTPSEDSDEFTSPMDLLASNTSGWQILHPDRAASVDIGMTAPGRLTVVAANGRSWAWYADSYGPLVYREIAGDFAVVTRLRVVDDANPSRTPTGSFNAGGFVIRNPAGTHSRNEDWIMFNFGTQGSSGYSREVKKTVHSQSRLFLNAHPFEETTIGVCRVGDRFRFMRWDSPSGAWITEVYDPNSTEVNGSARIAPEVNPSTEGELYFVHSGIPDEVQVGVMAHSWQSPDSTRTRAEIDFVRFALEPPTDPADCEDALPSPI